MSKAAVCTLYEVILDWHLPKKVNGEYYRIEILNPHYYYLFIHCAFLACSYKCLNKVTNVWQKNKSLEGAKQSAITARCRKGSINMVAQMHVYFNNGFVFVCFYVNGKYLQNILKLDFREKEIVNIELEYFS